MRHDFKDSCSCKMEVPTKKQKTSYERKFFEHVLFIDASDSMQVVMTDEAFPELIDQYLHTTSGRLILNMVDETVNGPADFEAFISSKLGSCSQEQCTDDEDAIAEIKEELFDEMCKWQSRVTASATKFENAPVALNPRVLIMMFS